MRIDLGYTEDMSNCDAHGHLWTYHQATETTPRYWNCGDCGTVDVP